MRTLFFLFSAGLIFLSGCKKEVSTPEVLNKDSVAVEKPKLLCLGTSLTAAYNLDPSEGWVAQIRKKVDSLGYPYEVVMAGVSGETTSGLRSRLGWMLQGDIQVVVLESGANDGLRGTEIKTTRDNLSAIIDTIRVYNPEMKIVLAGMAVPPNMGPVYTQEFMSLFPGLAKSEKVELIPFLLEGVGGIKELNLPDGIHPNPAGQKIVAETVWRTLKPVLDSATGSRGN